MLMRWIVLVSLSGGSGGSGGLDWEGWSGGPLLQRGLGSPPDWEGCCIHRAGRASLRGQKLLRGPEEKNLLCFFAIKLFIS